ncbi:MAG: polysaccharide deacetylase family protein [Clostridia bacterium]|nr:polysaccharide deacetylase family protein [Clostridia bacterium]
MKRKCIEKEIFTVFTLIIILVGTVLLYKARYEAKQTLSTENVDIQIAVPILMYHSVCDNKKVTSNYRVTPEVLESDLEYLRKNGYETIFVSDLVAFVHEGAALPEKPIIITLDDGYLNNMTNVFPLLEKYNMCAVVSVVGEFAESFSAVVDRNPLYAYLTFEDMKYLRESGRIEIGNHTYAMHELGERRGCAKIDGESMENYDKALTEDLVKMQTVLKEKVGVTPTVFTYPYGFVSKESLPIIKKIGFLAALTCYEHINYINGTPEQLYKLGRFNRPPNISTEEFMKKIGV